MGRVRRAKSVPIEAHPRRHGRAVICRQNGGSGLDPFRLLLVAFVACFFFVGTVFSQTTPAQSSAHNSPSQIVKAVSENDSAALDPNSNIANPFATPWLMSGQAAVVPNTKLPSASDYADSATPLPKTTYKLEPDPFGLNSDLNAPNDNDHIAANSNASIPAIAMDLSAMPPAKLQSGRQSHPMAIPAKYDIDRIGDRGIGTKLNFFSIEKEQALGRDLSQQIEQQAKLITDPVVTEYVNRIGQTLVRHSDARVPFTIKVVDDEQVNAFALPGGFFYVNTGVILAADSEAELAGVMAHEIAHVAARHATRNATKQEIWNLASMPMIFFGGPVVAVIRQVSSIVVPMSFLKFSRDAEREADFLGLEYQYASGYDPTAFVDFFEKLEAQEKSRAGFVARAFSTHPMNDDRIRRAEAELEMLPARENYIVSTSEFDQVKARLIRLTRGRSVSGDKPGTPTLRKHTVTDDKPPVLQKPSDSITRQPVKFFGSPADSRIQ